MHFRKSYDILIIKFLILKKKGLIYLKRAISVLLILATLLGSCTMLFACKKDTPENTEDDNGLKYATEAVVDFNVAENITASGLAVKTDVVKTATSSASWKPAEKATVEFAVPENMTDMTLYRELSIWMNNVSGKDYKLIITLVSDNPGTDVIDGYKTVALNIHAGWQMYNIPLSEMTNSESTVIGTPIGVNNITKITFSTADGVDASGVEIVIDTINRKTQKFGTMKFFSSYPEIANAVLFYDQHNKYLYNQSRCVLDEGKELVEIKADTYTTYVPVSILAQHRGATNISASAEKVSFNYNGTAYEFTPARDITFTGNNRGFIPGQTKTVKPVVMGDYIMLPMEYCASLFGYKLYYNKMGLVIFSDTEHLYFQSGMAYEEDSLDNNSMVYDLILQLVNDNYTGKELLQNMDALYGTDNGTMRLLIDQERIDELRELVETDALYGAWFRNLESSYNKNLPTKKFVFNLYDGYRMLDIAREFMNLCVPYSFLYKMTDNEDYAQVVLNAMLDFTTFVDPWTKCPSWHVEHPLDFGEIMYGYAIGYNWLYDWFDEEDRKTIEKAAWEIGYGTFLGFGESMQWWGDPANFEAHKANLTDKQIEEGDFIKLKNQGRIGWYYPGPAKLKEFGETVGEKPLLKPYNITTESLYAQDMWVNNYNAVCNGGLITFLIAFANVNENFRAATEYTLDCTNFAIQWGFKTGYAPDGGYPEGYVYWAYGTTYSAVLLQAMYNAFGTDQSFIDLPGFAEGFYYNIYIGTGEVGGWNYHDSDEIPSATNTALMLWAAYRLNDSDIAAVYVNRYLQEQTTLNTFSLFFYQPELIKTDVNLALDTTWSALSMSVFRSDWETENVFTGLHGGWNNWSHSMHDIGSFIVEFDGVRFFTVLGKDEYNIVAYQRPGSDGTEPSYKNNPQGYWLYRNRAEGSNTLVIDPVRVDTSNFEKGDRGQKTNWDQLHDVYSKTLRYESGTNSALAIVDMSVAYDAPYVDRMVKGSGRRGLLLTENRSTVVIQDEFTLTPTKKHTVYWFAHTPRGMECTISDDGKTAILTMDGKSMLVQLVTPKGATYDFNFSFGPADYLPETGLSSVELEYSRVGLGKLIAKGVNLSGTVKFAVVCRLLSSGASSYTYTNLDDWKVD